MTAKIETDKYRVKPGERLKLEKRPTLAKPFFESKKEYRELLDQHVEELDALQRVQYASGQHALLLIFQGMDAAGKDGAIRHLLSGVNPQGTEVTSFKQPSAEELDHDFLWRTYRALPRRGRIGIFNRSYYEEVLVVRVHPEILGAQRLPDHLAGAKDIWKQRFRSIVDMESHLSRNGTVVLKFFLHLSRDEQRKRFLDRLEEPDKNWKLTRADISERKLWDDYMAAYEECLAATSTAEAPWYVVPADDKRSARLVVSRIVVDAMKALKLEYPKPEKGHAKELKAIRDELMAS